ncbi:hypothetical protein X975_07387, partial [Stegodyphus mimosarum]
MAACSDMEEKTSSSKDSLPLKFYVEDGVNHVVRENCYSDVTNINMYHETFSEVSEGSKTGDLTTLSDDEFLHLLKEASTFNKPNNQESVLLKQLRKEVAETEPRENNLVESSCASERSENRRHTKILLYSETNSTALNSSGISSSHHRTLESKKKVKNREEPSSKSVLNVDVGQNSIQQSQSLQDLLSSDSSKSKQKPQKTQRTLSLSSSETVAIDSDSFSSSSKTSKKSNKSSSLSGNSSKSESNKSGLSKCHSKTSGNFVSLSINLNAESESQKHEPCAQNDNLPYQSLVTENDIPVSGNRKQKENENIAYVSPIEIEMEEIKPDSKSNKDETLSSKAVEKTKSGSQQSNSKFYVDCNDVDSTVTFPLKLVSSIDDQPNSSESISEQMKRQVNYPLSPWSRPLQVQSFFSSLPMESDPFSTRNEKQLLNTDINGNPFSRASRPSSLASFVSTTLLDYNNSALVAESKNNRKNKRQRNSVNKGVLSENIEGHRGNEDLDSLVQYINSSDKKSKTPIKGGSQNHVISNKSSMNHDQEKKKNFGKEIKNCQKSAVNGDKKKLSRSNSLEDLNQNNINNDADVFSAQTNVQIMDVSIKDPKAAHLENAIVKNLDINSNVENQFLDTSDKKDTGIYESNNQAVSMQYSVPEVSSFAADFYSTVDVSSQTVEESGFHIVKKKQRKKHQSKRSDSYRWRTAQTQRKKGMMLSLAESKCGKQDSRRKSTSSVPHSEHSSADNSDLDSVHSLPVRGSVPHPTQPHPHTTPSSSSSTPQASYADIARMPISKISAPSPCIITYSAQQTSTFKQQSNEYEIRRTENSTSGGYSKRRDDMRDLASLNNKGACCVVAAEKESNSNTSEIKVRSFTRSTREINTQTEPETVSISETLKIDSAKLKANQKEELNKGACNVCLCLLRKNCSCSKSHTSGNRQKLKNSDIPPVIMDNMPLESNACNVSFGFGIEEVLDMSAEKTSCSSFETSICDEIPGRHKESETAGKCCNIIQVTGVNTKTCVSNSDSPVCNSLPKDIKSKTSLKVDLSHNPSSHLKTVCYGTGKNLYYSEPEVNIRKFNLSELSNF